MQANGYNQAICNYSVCEPFVRKVKFGVEHALWIPGTFSPPLRVSDPDKHHGTCVTHLLWCMPESLTSGFLLVGGGENVPAISGAYATLSFMYLIRGPWKVPLAYHCRECVYQTILVVNDTPRMRSWRHPIDTFWQWASQWRYVPQELTNVYGGKTQY